MLVCPLPSPSSYCYLSDSTCPILLEGGTFLSFHLLLQPLARFFCFFTLHFFTLRALISAGSDLRVRGLSRSPGSRAKDPGVSSSVSGLAGFELAWCPTAIRPLHRTLAAGASPSPFSFPGICDGILDSDSGSSVYGSPYTTKQLLDTSRASYNSTQF